MQCLGGSPGHCTSQHRLAPALHMVSFEKFVKSLPPSLLELKVKPIFCFPIKIRDDPTASKLCRYTTHRPKFSYFFDSCLHWVSIVRQPSAFPTKISCKFLSVSKIPNGKHHITTEQPASIFFNSLNYSKILL